MGRKFDLMQQGRLMKICVVAVDEAWEFWLCECGCRLALAGTITIEAAIDSWRQGRDPIVLEIERLQSAAANGELILPNEPGTEGPKCNVHCRHKGFDA